MKRSRYVLVLVAALASLPAASAEPIEQRTGDETRAWLELQTSGSAAAEDPRPMNGEVADEVYRRYLNSYKHAIPEMFQRDRFVNSGGGSGGGGGN